jgi:hypothetical protein
MKYRIIDNGDNGIVKADIFDYNTGIKNILIHNYINK